MIEDPTIDAARDRVLSSLSRLESSRRRAAAALLGEPPPRTAVTQELLARLSRSKWASTELRGFASMVSAGESSWDRIEVDSRPTPPEVTELRADRFVDWPDNWPIEPDEEPYRIPWQ